MKNEIIPSFFILGGAELLSETRARTIENPAQKLFNVAFQQG
jgi:hypothetical protein